MSTSIFRQPRSDIDPLGRPATFGAVLLIIFRDFFRAISEGSTGGWKEMDSRDAERISMEGRCEHLFRAELLCLGEFLLFNPYPAYAVTPYELVKGIYDFYYCALPQKRVFVSVIRV